MGMCACILNELNNKPNSIDISNLKQDNNNINIKSNNNNNSNHHSTLANPQNLIDIPMDNLKQEILDKTNQIAINPSIIPSIKPEESPIDDNNKITTIEQCIVNIKQTDTVPIQQSITTNTPLLPLIPAKDHSHLNESEIPCSHRSISRFINRSFINIVILGGKGVGKSCFVFKYVDNFFEKCYIPTLGAELKCKKLSYNTHNYSLNFTVTAGNNYKSDYSKAYKTVDFFLMMYDVTSMESFEEIKKLLKSEVKEYLYSYGPTMTNIIVIGNKIDDSPRCVTEEVARKFCDKHNFQFYEISIKMNRNMSVMMQKIIKTVDDLAYPSA